MAKTIFFTLHLLFCLSLSHAQTPSAPATTPAAPTSSIYVAPPPAVTINPFAPQTTPVQNPLPTTPLTTEKKGTLAKYQEYQSICRTNDYDKVSSLKDDVKNKRINLLQEKIKAGKDTNKFHLRLLKEYIDQQKSNEAASAYTTIKDLKLTAEENLLADGYHAFSQRKFKIAQTNLEKALASDPKNIELAKFLAEVYKEQKNYYEAEQIYTDLNKQFSGGFYEYLCEVLILDSHHADGEKACRKAIIEKPNSPYPLIYLGISSREKEIIKDAYDHFKNSLKVKETEMGFTCLAELYVIENKFTSAIEYFTKSLNHTPQSQRALIGLAWAQVKNHNTDDAVKSFAKLCSIDRKLGVELKKAYTYAVSQNSSDVKKFGDQLQICNQ